MIITVAGTYLAFAIGSGFASGQEILQYFTVYGAMGFVALIAFCIIGSAMDTEFIVVGQREQFEKKVMFMTTTHITRYSGDASIFLQIYFHICATWLCVPVLAPH